MEIEQKEFDDSLIKVFNSCISKCEKVVTKLDSESWQAKWTERQLDAYRLSLDMLLNLPNADYTNERLINAEKTLRELLAKCEEMIAKLKEGSSQHTLALRRHRAFSTALGLIRKQINMVEIRKYNPCDLSEIWQLFYETVHIICAKDYSFEQLSVWAANEVDVAKWAKNAVGENTIVATFEGKIVGFCDINSNGYINMFYVHKDYIGRGIGKLMFSSLLKTMQANKISTYASITARPFFEKLGFMTINENTVKRNGVALTNFYMTLPNPMQPRCRNNTLIRMNK